MTENEFQGFAVRSHANLAEVDDFHDFKLQFPETKPAGDSGDSGRARLMRSGYLNDEEESEEPSKKPVENLFASSLFPDPFLEANKEAAEKKNNPPENLFASSLFPDPFLEANKQKQAEKPAVSKPVAPKITISPTDGCSQEVKPKEEVFTRPRNRSFGNRQMSEQFGAGVTPVEESDSMMVSIDALSHPSMIGNGMEEDQGFAVDPTLVASSGLFSSCVYQPSWMKQVDGEKLKEVMARKGKRKPRVVVRRELFPQGSQVRRINSSQIHPFDQNSSKIQIPGPVVPTSSSSSIFARSRIQPKPSPLGQQTTTDKEQNKKEFDPLFDDNESNTMYLAELVEEHKIGAEFRQEVAKAAKAAAPAPAPVPGAAVRRTVSLAEEDFNLKLDFSLADGGAKPIAAEAVPLEAGPLFPAAEAAQLAPAGDEGFLGYELNDTQLSVSSFIDAGEDAVVEVKVTDNDVEMLAKKGLLFVSELPGAEDDFTLDIDKVIEQDIVFPFPRYDIESMNKEDPIIGFVHMMDELREKMWNSYDCAKKIVAYYLYRLKMSQDLTSDEIESLFGGVEELFFALFSIIIYMRKDECDPESLRNENPDYYTGLVSVIKESNMVDAYIKFTKLYYKRSFILEEVKSQNDKRFTAVKDFLIQTKMECGQELSELFDGILQNTPKLDDLSLRISVRCEKNGFMKMKDDFAEIGNYYVSFKKRANEQLVNSHRVELVRSIERNLVNTIKKTKVGFFQRKKKEEDLKFAEGLADRNIVASHFARGKLVGNGMCEVFYFILYDDLLLLTTSIEEVKRDLKVCKFDLDNDVTIVRKFLFDYSTFKLSSPSVVICSDGINMDLDLTIKSEEFLALLMTKWQEYRRNHPQ